MTERKTNFERKSKETEIKGVLNIDGRGVTNIKTPIGLGLLDHMLELFAFHGFFDLELEVKGDTHIDIHHTNEDIGIVLGKAFKKVLGENLPGIKRFGRGAAPMESTWSDVVIDISGRGYLRLSIDVGELHPPVYDGSGSSDGSGSGRGSGSGGGSGLGDGYGGSREGYFFNDLEHFLESFALNLGATLNVTIHNPANGLHTIMETVFKSLGLALDQATQIDPRRSGAVPSTKGRID